MKDTPNSNTKYEIIYYTDMYLESEEIKGEDGEFVTKISMPWFGESGFTGHVYRAAVKTVDGVEVDNLEPIGINKRKNDAGVTFTIIEESTERLERAKDYQKNHPDEKVIHEQRVQISEEGFYAVKANHDILRPYFVKPEDYEPIPVPLELIGGKELGVFQDNCGHWVNSENKRALLEGSYLYNYTEKDISNAPGWIHKGIGFFENKQQFVSGDKERTELSNLSLEEFAKANNLPVDRIRKKELVKLPEPDELMLQPEEKNAYVIAPNPALVAEEAAGRIQRAFRNSPKNTQILAAEDEAYKLWKNQQLESLESLYPNIEGGIFEGIFEEVEKQPREESTSARSVVYLPTHETTASIKDGKSTAQDLLELQRSNFQAITATEGTQLDENFAQLAVTEEERESKVKSIVVTALKAFTGKFKAMRDKFIKKLVEQSEKEISDLKEAGQAEYNTGEKAIHQQKEQEIEAKGEQLKSSFDSQVAALEQRKQGECDAFFLKGQSECEAVFAARCGAASNQPSTSGLALSICVSNSDVVAQKNSELSAFKAQKSAEMEAEIQALRAQNINELKSFADSKEEEADQRCKELQSSINQRIQSTRKSVIELAENEVNKEETQIAKYKRKIKDIQDDNVLIDRIKELVGNSGDASAEALINEELNVFLQGAASDFGVDAVIL